MFWKVILSLDSLNYPGKETTSVEEHSSRRPFFCIKFYVKFLEALFQNYRMLGVIPKNTSLYYSC